MRQVFSPRQVAKAIGASESSVKRWCDRGVLESVRTAGGHRRVPLAGVLDFVRERNHPIVEPTELGLPLSVGMGRVSTEAATEEFRKALYDGNHSVCRRVLFDLFLNKHSVSFICDNVMTPAMHSMGDDWCDGNIEIFEERRGCELALRLIYDLRSMLRLPRSNAPLAMGASVESDPYVLPTRMVEMTMVDCGWNAISLGCGVPLNSLKSAIITHSPRLLWLSVSAVRNEQQFIDDYADLFEACERVLVVLGGRGLTQELREKIQYTTYCESLGKLEDFVKSVHNSSETKA